MLRGSLYGEIECIIGNGHMGTPSWWTNILTDTHDWKHYLPATSLAGGKNEVRLHSSHLLQLIGVGPAEKFVHNLNFFYF